MSYTGSGQGRLGEGFPVGNYTPFGYLDNPYHTLWLNYSGMIRTAPPLGFRFREQETIVGLAIELNGKTYSKTTDFATADLHSSYHSKNIFSYDWSIEGLDFTATYFLESVEANGLNCEVKIENNGSSIASVELRAALSLPPLDFDHYIARVYGENGVIMRRFAEGPVYVFYSESEGLSRAVGSSRQAVDKYVEAGQREGLGTEVVNVKGDYIGGVIGFRTSVIPRKMETFRFTVARGVSQVAALKTAREAFAKFEARFDGLIQDDKKFWESCPRLTGDWPELWKRGIVYDWETLRMNVRRPIGVYKHHWDGMQVMIPRSVLAETAIDMFAYSYADPDMAKEVIYGLFADAIAPNVPCMREDGSANMVSESGSESGTAPSWCVPFLAIRSIYARTNDRGWASDLYPRLEDFMDWWFANRTHEDSAFFFDNSWESGQDQSSRFLVEQKTGGAGIQFIEPVDLHASIADGAELLARIANLLDKDDGEKWLRLAAQYKQKIDKFWSDGVFSDIDRRSGKHTRTNSTYLLLPYLFHLTNAKQDENLRQQFEAREFQSLSDWAGGAPSFQVIVEGMWTLGERKLQAEHIANQLDYVYSWWDRRTWETPEELPQVWGHVDRPANLREYHRRTWDARTGMIDQSTNPQAPPRPFGIPMPGVAVEGWKGRRGHPVGMENYGWGATLPMHFIRGVVGYRELPIGSSPGFILAPAIPSKLLELGKEYGMSNLHYNDMDFDVVYRVQDEGNIHVTFSWRAPTPRRPILRSDDQRIISEALRAQGRGSLTFVTRNYAVHTITFE